MWKIAVLVVLMSGGVVTALGCGGSPTRTAVVPPLVDVTGVVSAFGLPVEGAHVDVTFAASTTTDQLGRYRLPRPSGGLSMSAWKPGYYTEWAFLSARDSTADFQLQSAPTIDTGQTATGAIAGGKSTGPWCGVSDSFTCVVFRWVPVVTESVEVSVTWNKAVSVRGSVITSTEEWVTPPANPLGNATMLVPASAGTIYEVRVTASGPTEVAVTLTRR